MSQNTPVPEPDQPHQAAQSPAGLPASDPPATDPAAPTEVLLGEGAASASESIAPAASAEAAGPAEPAEPAQTAETAVTAEPAEPAPTAAAAEPAPKAPAIPDLSPAACAALLAERFPALFGVGRALPIKLRIQADIQERAPGVFNKKSLSIFLHRHTTSTAYIKALVNSPQRIDLDGQPAGEIAQEHKDAGVTELQRRQAIVQARRVAEREAQRTPRRGPAGVAAEGGAPVVAEGEATANDMPPLADAQPPRPPRPPHGDRPPRGPRLDAGSGTGTGTGTGPGSSSGPGSGSGSGAPRADRPPRGDRPAQARQNDRGPRPPRAEPGNRPPRSDVQGQGDRAPRLPGPPGESRGPRPDRAQRPDRPDRSLRPEQAGERPFTERPALADAASAAPAVALTPEQVATNEARRSRAALLRAFESTTLTAANFCALKGLKVDALNAALEQARQERGPVATAPAAAPRANPGFAPRPGGRRP